MPHTHTHTHTRTHTHIWRDARLLSAWTRPLLVTALSRHKCRLLFLFRVAAVITAISRPSLTPARHLQDASSCTCVLV